MQFHAVAGPYHLVDKAGKSYSQWRDNEERRPSAREVQRIQDFGGPDRVRSVVEGQENMTINPALRSTALTRCRLSRIQLLFLGLGCHQLGLAVHRLDEGLAVLVPLFVVAYLPNLYFGEPFYLLLLHRRSGRRSPCNGACDPLRACFAFSVLATCCWPCLEASRFLFSVSRFSSSLISSQAFLGR